MKRLTLALLGVFFSLTALGQDLLQCLNPDLVKGVLFNGRPEAQMSITATLPEALAGYQAPSGFALVGSAVRRDGASTTVAYRTSLDREAAYAALLASFEAEGWVIEELPLGPVEPIFVEPAGPVSGSICLDGERRFLNVDDVEGRRFATIALNDQPTARACNAEDPRLRGLGSSMMSMLTEAAPTLELPEGTTAADGSGRINSGGGGSGDTYRTESQIRITVSASAFMDRLAEQVRAQGWTADARWTGALSHGGRWIRTSDDGTMFWSTLELIDVGDGIYDLSFRIMMPPL